MFATKELESFFCKSLCLQCLESKGLLAVDLSQGFMAERSFECWTIKGYEGQASLSLYSEFIHHYIQILQDFGWS